MKFKDRDSYVGPPLSKELFPVRQMAKKRLVGRVDFFSRLDYIGFKRKKDFF